MFSATCDWFCTDGSQLCFLHLSCLWQLKALFIAGKIDNIKLLIFSLYFMKRVTDIVFCDNTLYLFRVPSCVLILLVD